MDTPICERSYIGGKMGSTIHHELSISCWLGCKGTLLEITYSTPKFFDLSNSDFRPIHGACDSVYHRLHSSGIGTSVNHTSTLTATQEDTLGSLGIFGCDNPKSLQRTVFFILAKDFVLEVGKKCVNLVLLSLREALILIVSLM